MDIDYVFFFVLPKLDGQRQNCWTGKSPDTLGMNGPTLRQTPRPSLAPDSRPTYTVSYTKIIVSSKIGILDMIA